VLEIERLFYCVSGEVWCEVMWGGGVGREVFLGIPMGVVHDSRYFVVGL